MFDNLSIGVLPIAVQAARVNVQSDEDGKDRCTDEVAEIHRHGSRVTAMLAERGG